MYTESSQCFILSLKLRYIQMDILILPDPDKISDIKSSPSFINDELRIISGLKCRYFHIS